MNADPSEIDADGRLAIYTIGHSTRSIAELLSLLASHGVGEVADVRRFPASRRHPHFSREALARSLNGAGIGYVWLPDLGGRRPSHPDSPHTAWKNAAFRGYADHMDSVEFERGLQALLDEAARQPTAILCAEATPWRCHRQLIADSLVVRGIEVRHILGPVGLRVHRLTAFARIEDRRVVYDGGQPLLPHSG